MRECPNSRLSNNDTILEYLYLEVIKNNTLDGFSKIKILKTKETDTTRHLEQEFLECQ